MAVFPLDSSWSKFHLSIHQHNKYVHWIATQGCVFTRDINKAILISDAMETGTVQINSAPARGPDHFPFQVNQLWRKPTPHKFLLLWNWNYHPYLFFLDHYFERDLVKCYICRVWRTVESVHKELPTALTWWPRSRALSSIYHPPHTPWANVIPYGGIIKPTSTTIASWYKLQMICIFFFFLLWSVLFIMSLLAIIIKGEDKKWRDFYQR